MCIPLFQQPTWHPYVPQNGEYIQVRPYTILFVLSVCFIMVLHSLNKMMCYFVLKVTCSQKVWDTSHCSIRCILFGSWWASITVTISCNTPWMRHISCPHLTQPTPLPLTPVQCWCSRQMFILQLCSNSDVEKSTLKGEGGGIGELAFQELWPQLLLLSCTVACFLAVAAKNNALISHFLGRLILNNHTLQVHNHTCTIRLLELVGTYMYFECKNKSYQYIQYLEFTCTNLSHCISLCSIPGTRV